MQDTEIFLPIRGYEGIYEISNYGTLKRLDKGTFPKGSPNKQGYIRYKLSVNDVCKNYFGHVLVAKAFIANTENKPQVNHIDGNAKNNHVSNLEWCTAKENVRHAFRTGLSTNKGINNSRCRLSETQVIEIYKSKETALNLSKIYNVNPCTIRDIKRNRNWKHLTNSFMVMAEN
jgi:hypothetical protein